MYKDELRRFRAYMVKRVDSDDLRNLNLLGVQFALCEASKHHAFEGPIKGSPRMSKVGEQRLRFPWLPLHLGTYSTFATKAAASTNPRKRRRSC